MRQLGLRHLLPLCPLSLVVWANQYLADLDRLEDTLGPEMSSASGRTFSANRVVNSPLYLASILTTGNNAHGKSVFQFMGLVIGIFSIELLLSNEIPKKYCRIALVLGKVMRLHEDNRK